ncbi:MAG: hypothetical protein N3B13_01400 [Deltaproteobacteria bacterium]|nr:hypothetical protein [Deltaproteobacteria bacterium]
MKRIIFLIFGLVTGFNLYPSDIPAVITHQGYITDKDGKGVTGELNFSIGIYKSIDGDNTDLVWEEDLGSVNVRDGFYFIRVGDKGGLKDIFSGYTVLYLEVRVNGKALSPRQGIGSVPYAFVAGDAVGDIHPRSVSVGGKKVIDEGGNWVGGIPMGKASGTSDGYLTKEDYNRFSNKQERVSGSCGANMCMVSINSDGSVNCEPCGGGGGAVYTAGSGLVLSNYQFSLDAAYLSGSAYDGRFVNAGEADSITNKMIKAGSIEAYHLSGEICGGVSDSVLYFDGTDWRCRQYASGTGTVTVVNTGAGLQGGPITTSGTISLRVEYQSGSVYDSRFVNTDETDSITTAMIKDRAITFNKMANNGCSANQYIKWDGSNWTCSTISGGGTVTQINTAAPLLGGPITTSGTISIQQATATTNGYLSSADYQRFDAKQDALGYTPVNRAGDTMTGALNLPSNGLTVGGNQLIATGNNIGIGTSNPKSKLHTVGDIVLGNDVNGQKFIFHSRSAFSGDFLQITGDDASGSWEWGKGISFVRSTGYVGINTTTPAGVLEIKYGNASVAFKPVVGNYGNDVYGTWAIGSSTDTCDGNISTEYSCGINESRTCIDVLLASPFYMNRTVTCRKETRLQPVYTDQIE